MATTTRVQSGSRPNTQAEEAPRSRPEAARRTEDRLVEACVLAAVLVVPLIVVPTFASAFSVPKTSALLLLAGVALAGAGVSWWRGGRTASGAAALWRPVWWGALAYTVALGLSVLFSVSPEASFWGSFPDQLGLVASVQLAMVCLALLVAVGLPRSAQQWRVACALVAVGTAVAALGLVQQVVGDPLGMMRERYRVISTLGNATVLGGALVLTAPFTTLLAAQWLVRSLAPSPRPRILAVTVLLFAALVVQVVVLLLTQSRGPLVALGIAASTLVLLSALFLPRRLAMAALGVVVAAGLLAAALLPIVASSAAATQARDPRLTSADAYADLVRRQGIQGAAEAVGSGAFDIATSGRLIVWRLGLDVVLQRPWPEGMPGPPAVVRHLVGYGPDTSRVANRVVYPAELRAFELTDRFLTAHNLPLQILIELGWLGLAGFGSMVLACSAAGLLRLRARANDLGTLPVVAAGAAVVGHLAAQLIGVPSTGADVLFWVSLGILGAPAQVAARRGTVRLPRIPALLVVAAGLWAAVVGPLQAFAEAQASGGLIALTRSDVPAAERGLRLAAGVAPWAPPYQTMLGMTYGAVAVQTDAPRERAALLRAEVASLDAALAHDPTNLLALMERAWAGGLLGADDRLERERARRTYGRLLALAPDEPTLVLGAAYAHVQWSEPEAALALLDGIRSDITRRNQAAYDTYSGMALADTGHTVDALRAIDQALAATGDPDEVVNLLRLRAQIASESSGTPAP